MTFSKPTLSQWFRLLFVKPKTMSDVSNDYGFTIYYKELDGKMFFTRIEQ